MKPWHAIFICFVGSTLAVLTFLGGCATQNSGLDINPAHAQETVTLFTHSSYQSAAVVKPAPKATMKLIPGLATVTWEPTDGAVSYNLLYGFRSRGYTYEVSGLTNSTATVTNLIPGKDYFFSVFSVDTNGLRSDFSDEEIYDSPQFAELSFPTNGTSLEASRDLISWHPRAATQFTNKWRIILDASIPMEFYRAK